MNNSSPASERQLLLEALYQKYGTEKDFAHRFFYWRKKYFWILTISVLKGLKRMMDIVIGGGALILLSPLMLLIAAMIKISDGGSVFYLSDRVGKWGQEFKFIKFRTMVVNADALKKNLESSTPDQAEVRFKMKQDPRITAIGGVLRKTSLDELPQLWHVVTGEMSLVGPRPPLPSEVAKYTLKERRRLDVKPGLTCIWQVSGRSDVPFPQQVKLDLEYIESQSFGLDLWLLLKTIPAVLFGRGAY